MSISMKLLKILPLRVVVSYCPLNLRYHNPVFPFIRHILSLGSLGSTSRYVCTLQTFIVFVVTSGHLSVT